MRNLVQVELPDGQLIWARIEADGPRDVAFDQMPRVLKGLTETVRGVAANVRHGLREMSPDEVSVEFGVALAMSGDGLVAALAGVHGSASITVKLSWQADPVGPGAH